MVRKAIEIDKLASDFLKLAKKHKDQIPGGMADKKQPKDFDKKQLEMGKKVEMEHTDNPTKAVEISMDHLDEFGNYYTALDKMEKKLEKKKEKGKGKKGKKNE